MNPESYFTMHSQSERELADALDRRLAIAQRGVTSARQVPRRSVSFAALVHRLRTAFASAAGPVIDAPLECCPA